MNESENQFAAKPGSDVEELRGELQALRASFSAALLLLFVFGSCVNIFLLRQANAMGAQATQARMIVSAWAPGGPAQLQAADFWNKLTDFSRTHPDFAPIITKYSQFINTKSGTTAGAAKK